MSDTKIFILETDQSVFGVVGPRHLGIAIIKDGTLRIIDGGQSEGFQIEAGEVPVSNQQGPIFGNLILNVQQFEGSTEDFLQILSLKNAVELSIDAAEIDQKAQAILDEVGSIGPLRSEIDSEGDEREYYDYNISYNPLGANSNSVANTLLGVAGIDLRQVVESPSEDFVGHMGLVDSSGDDNFTAYANSGTFKATIFHDDDSSDHDTITIKNGATLIIKDNPIGGTNEIILDGFNVADIRLEQKGNDLFIVEENGLVDNLVAAVYGHFDDGNFSSTVLKLDDGAGNITVLKDLANLNSSDLGKSIFDLPSWFTGTVTFFGVALVAAWDPLVIDLDNDGIATDAQGRNQYFDLDGDGYGQLTGWAGADDGFLVRDINSNGRIDDGGELFGDATTDGFTALAAHDSNSDGIINVSDTIWSDLLIWQDKNSDGQTQNDELLSLASLNITGIDVANVSVVDINSNAGQITHTGTVTTTTGTLTAGNYNFAMNEANTRYTADYDFDLRAAFLPNLRGYNQLADMHIALSLDNDDQDPNSLMAIMQGIASYSLTDALENWDAVRGEVENLLYRWAGVEAVDPNSRGNFIDDARQLAFVESYLGNQFVDNNGWGGNPQSVQAREFQSLWNNNIFPRLLSAILMQTQVAQILGGETTYDLVTDDLIRTTTFDQDAIDALEASATALPDTASRQDFWLGVTELLASVRLSFTSGELLGFPASEELKLEAAIENSDSSLTWDTTNHDPVGGITSIEHRFYNPLGETITGDANVNDFFVNPVFGGTINDDTIFGLGGDDVLAGNLGNDYILGGDGNDTLYGQAGDDVLDGGDGDDILEGGGGSGADHLIGGAGNDVLHAENAGVGGQILAEGGTGDDTYYVLRESWLDETNGDGNDTVIIGSGQDASDLTYERYGDDILVRFYNGSTGGNFVIRNHFNNGPVPIETISFVDGGADVDLTTFSGNVTTYGTNAGEIINGIATGAGIIDTIFASGGNDEIYGGAGDDEIYGEGGDDILDGGAGDDFLSGHLGADTYLISSGTDEILEANANIGDVVKFGAGVTLNDLDLVRYTTALNDLNIIHATGLTTVTLQFIGGKIEELQFDDGTIYQMSDVSVITEGTSGADTISGITLGASQNDILKGFAGDDTLNGGNGNDILHGGSGNDTLNGGNGSNTAAYSFAASGVTVDLSLNQASNDGDGGQDAFTSIHNIIGSAFADNLTGSSSINVLEGGAGNDTIDGKGGSDYASYKNSTAGINIDLSLGQASNDGFGNTDTLISIENINGSQHSDIIKGDASDNLLAGMAGNDTLNGNAGSDTANYLEAPAPVNVDLSTGQALDDGFGNTDTFISIENINGSQFSDVLTGDSGANIIFGFGGHDIINSGAGNDTIDGGDGNDIIDGGDGNDVINGGRGINVMRGGLGDDTLIGGIEEDFFYSSVGTDSFDGGSSGFDTLDYSLAAGGISLDLRINKATNDGDGSSDTVKNIRNIIGSSFNDFMVTGTGTTNFFGGAGDDVFVPIPEGSDLFDGGDGVDVVNYSNADEGIVVDLSQEIASKDGKPGFFSGVPGVDSLVSIENIVGSAHNDIIYGSDLNNEISGGNGNDTIQSGLGNDVLIGNVGNDSLEGGDGNDEYIFNAGDGQDTITDTNGAYDFIRLGAGIVVENLTLTDVGNNLEITFADNPSDKITIIGHTSTGTQQIEKIVFDDLSELSLVAPPNTAPVANDDNETTDQDVAAIIDVLANDSDADLDTLSVLSLGTASNGTLVLNGNNTVTYTPNAGFSGADSFTYTVDDGNGGTDTGTVNVTVNAVITYNVINGTSANNTLNGTSGNDEIHGMTGHDYLYGLGNGDILFGENGHDYLYGGDGDDTLYGGDVNGQDDNSNHLYGDAGNDILYAAGLGGDRLYGGAGDDVLHSNGGVRDRLYGDGGNDTLYADNGTDGEFQGGADIDTVVYNADSAGFVLYRAQVGQLRLVDTNGTYGENIIIYDDVENLQFSDLTLDLTSLTFTVGGAGWGTTVPKYLGSGNQTYTAYPVASEIHGGLGADTITGSQSDDTLFGDNGHDYLYGGDGDDTLYAGDVNGQDDNSNHLYGDAGNDILYAASIGGDRLYGGSGNDILHGNGGGYDRLYGDAGDDTLFADNGTNGEFQGGADSDTVVYNENSAGFVLYRAQAGQLRLVDTNGTYGENIIIYDDVENLQFSDLTLDLTSLTFTVGGAGWGTTVPKYLGSGNQTYTAYPVASEIHGGLGADTITGSQSDDTLFGDNGHDYLYGGDGDDTLYAGDVNGQDDYGNHLYGDAGDDILYGGNGGLDNLYGGTGADTFVFKDGVAFSYADRINDFSTTEGDSIDVSDILTGYDPLADLIADFVQITDNGTDSFLAVDADGGADNFVQIATLANVTGLTNEDALEAAGNLIGV